MTLFEGSMRVKQALRPCPICSQTEVQVLHNQKFVLPEDHPLKYGYDVVHCIRCGFVYADTQVTQADYDIFYKKYSKYEDKGTASGTGDTPWDQERLIQTASQVSTFVHNREARIVDIGCANGGLLRALSDKGFNNIIGLDPSPICVKNTRQLGVDAFAGSIFSLPKEIGKVDFILLSHVLEHIQELKPAVRAIRSILSDDGCIYIEVPDAQRYKDDVISPFQDFNTEHINHFSHICLSNLLEQEGFKLQSSGEKLLETAPGKPYPAIYSFWKKCNNLPESFSFHLRPDSDLLLSIQEYIRRSAALLQAFDNKIRSVLESSPEIIVWGTGQLTIKLLAETVLSEAKIVAFVDGNPINQGKTLHTVHIYGPDVLRSLTQPILIATTLHQDAIFEKIRSLGTKNPVIFLTGG